MVVWTWLIGVEIVRLLEPTVFAAGFYVGNTEKSQEWPLLMTPSGTHSSPVLLLHSAARARGVSKVFSTSLKLVVSEPGLAL